MSAPHLSDPAIPQYVKNPDTWVAGIGIRTRRPRSRRDPSSPSLRPVSWCKSTPRRRRRDFARPTGLAIRCIRLANHVVMGHSVHDGAVEVRRVRGSDLEVRPAADRAPVHVVVMCARVGPRERYLARPGPGREVRETGGRGVSVKLPFANAASEP